MATTEARIESWNPAITLRFAPVVALSDDQLFDFCQINRELRIERSAEGVLVIMAPAGALSSARNAEITRQLATWAAQDGTGMAFDSSAGFTLPNGALRSPDACWIPRRILAQVPPDALRKFPPVCPTFVVELRSPSDVLAPLQRKLREYIANGTQLGWLIDPDRRRVYVYRPGHPVQVALAPMSLSADPVLPGFALDLNSIW